MWYKIITQNNRVWYLGTLCSPKPVLHESQRKWWGMCTGDLCPFLCYCLSDQKEATDVTQPGSSDPKQSCAACSQVLNQLCVVSLTFLTESEREWPAAGHRQEEWWRSWPADTGLIKMSPNWKRIEAANMSLGRQALQEMKPNKYFQENPENNSFQKLPSITKENT